MGKIDTIFRNLNRRTGLDRQRNILTCPYCGWELSDDWFMDALSDAVTYYKHIINGKDINGKPVTATTYKDYQQYDGQPPAYLEIENTCHNSWEDDSGEYTDCDETIKVKFYLLGAETTL
jgi:hypothetical protein